MIFFPRQLTRGVDQDRQPRIKPQALVKEICLPEALTSGRQTRSSTRAARLGSETTTTTKTTPTTTKVATTTATVTTKTTTTTSTTTPRPCQSRVENAMQRTQRYFIEADRPLLMLRNRWQKQCSLITALNGILTPTLTKFFSKLPEKIHPLLLVSRKIGRAHV